MQQLQINDLKKYWTLYKSNSNTIKNILIDKSVFTACEL